MKSKPVMLGIVLAAVLLVLIVRRYDTLGIDPPNYPSTKGTVWLDQNWPPAQRAWFYHADQGTQTFGIPYEWFIALEQPTIFPSNPPSFLSDPTYLDRYGFIPSESHGGKAELPIGFAHEHEFKNPDGTTKRNPQTKSPMTSVGLTCAACHTGRLTYQDTAIIIDGGPAITNLSLFQKATGLSLILTKLSPFRFNRFADRVLGPHASSEAKSALKSQLDEVVAAVNKVRALQDGVKSNSIDEGYARLDALNRIGNIMFSVDRNFDPANFASFSAPVHFPRIWQASWFEWVQYNGSIEQPMTRNAGEALGVGAEINLMGPQDQLFSSSVDIETISKLEQSLAGPPPTAQSGFQGLTSPKWPDKILPPINTDLAGKGALLYKQRCEHCHLAPVSEPAFWSASQWSSASSPCGPSLDLNMVPIAEVGTDPAQAEDMKNRKISGVSSLGITATDFGEALRLSVQNTVDHWYETHQPRIPEDVRNVMNGCRQNRVRALLAYKVRPLNGIWATPPYLHNGSVPNLYALLSPVEERPKKFYLGNREYDPVNVGYRTEPFLGGFAFDTTLRGNHNMGHEFSDEKKPGVIGKALTPEERRQLIEFLKAL
jgi:RoxA-like, cytochrome c-like